MLVRTARATQRCAAQHIACSAWSISPGASPAPRTVHTGPMHTVPLHVDIHGGDPQHSIRPPLLLLHGLLGSATNWRGVQLKLKGLPTLACSLRNHGTSPHSADMSLEAMAEDVAQVIDHKCAGQPVELLGHSLGGKVAMILALKHPHLVRRLIVVDIAPKQYDESNPLWHVVTKIVRAAHDLHPEKYKHRADIDAALARSVSDPGVRSFVAQNLVPHHGTYHWRVNLPVVLSSMPAFAAFPPPPPESPYPPGEMPAHFIGGSLSPLNPCGHDEDRIRAFFPAAQFHTIPGAGHWVHAEKPAEFLATLSSILQLPNA